MHKSQILF